MQEVTNLSLGVTDQLYAVINACHHAQTADDIACLVRGELRELLPHEMAVCDIGNRKSFQVTGYVNVDFPDIWLNQVLNNKNVLNTPILKAWLITMQPVVVNDIGEMRPLDPEWTERAKAFNMKNIIAHGVVDIAGTMVSYVSLAKNPGNWTPLHRNLLELIVPHLHVAMIRIFSSDAAKTEIYIDLTEREREVLQWLYHGKTNPEIGCILDISSFTVKNHIHKIFEKLNVSNRSQAVAKAMTLDLIIPDLITP